MRFTVLGDATLDLIVRHPDPIHPRSDQVADISVQPGGQGANVAVRLARRGAGVTLVTALGDDVVGADLAARLSGEGIDLVGLPSARTGIVVSLVDRDGERAMLSDRARLRAADLTDRRASRALAEADWVHCSGYVLADAEAGPAVADVLGRRPRGQRCSVGGGSFQADVRLADLLRTVAPQVVLFDRGEAEAILGAHQPGARPAGDLAGALAAALGALAVVTDGQAGAATATPDGGVVSVPGEPVVAVDATGAGDAHAAVMLNELATSDWPPDLSSVEHALVRAGHAGAEVAAVVGAQARVPSESGP